MKTSFIVILLISMSAMAEERIIKVVPISESEYQQARRVGTFDLARDKCKGGDREAVTDATFVTRQDTTWTEWVAEYLWASSPENRYALRCQVTRLTYGELAADEAQVAALNRAEAARVDSLTRDNPKANFLDGILGSRPSSGSRTSGQ